ncbi:ACP S-malonyltransferase [Methylobacterium nigriterrae]|uniref:ACP S-malonyltransferase n=1 Tax=Methylobacterium nigriterrae TaxID=3127512 RepID=UPI003013AECA
MTLAILCSGQGAQHAAMFRMLAGEEGVRPILKRVGDLTGLDPFAASLDASPEALAANRVAQPLVVGHALAAHAILAARGITAAVYTGYSAGEFAAHGCSGALDALAILDLMARRAAVMDACVRDAAQGMLATIGLPLGEAEARARLAGVFVAIVNGPDHVVVGGQLAALERYEADAAARARHMRRLPVRVASHTPLMAAAAPGLRSMLESSGWRTPSAPTLSGLDGRSLQTPADAALYLSRQVHDRIDWARCVECVLEYGATAILEIGPGRALTKMIEESHPGTPVRAFEDFRTPAGAASWASRFA